MRSSILVFLLIWCGQSVWADNISFTNLQQNNANPFVRIHGLPGYTNPQLIDSKHFATLVNLEITNEFHQQVRSGERISLDYERAQLNFSFVYGLKSDLSAGLLLPYISNSGGFMDSLIEGWHDLFGLPQGGRDEVARDEFNISYQGSKSSFLIEDTGRGVGDITLLVGKQLITSEQQNLTTQLQLKLPTGDEDQLFGSGGYGLSLSLHGSKQLAEKWRAYGMLGLSYLQDSKVIVDQQENLVGNGVLGITWLANPKLGISIQLDLNSQVYNSTDLEALSGKAGVLNIAAGYQFSDRARLFFGFTEDVINKDAAPDFGINLGFQYRY